MPRTIDRITTDLAAAVHRAKRLNVADPAYETIHARIDVLLSELAACPLRGDRARPAGREAPVRT